MSEGYPPTLIYTWQPKSTAPEEINALIQRCFILSSFHPQPWSIEIILKNPPKKEKKLVSLSSTVSKSASVSATSSHTDEAIYFVRQPDIEVCCVVPKRKIMSTDGIEVMALTDNCEERWLTKTFPVVGKQGSSGTTDWVTRSIWRASGQRFIFSKEYVISIGYLEHMGASTQPCVEISLLLDDNTSNTGTAGGNSSSLDNLQLCTTKLHRIVTDLLSILALDNEILPSIDGNTSNSNSTTGEFGMSVGSRSLQWIHCL